MPNRIKSTLKIYIYIAALLFTLMPLLASAQASVMSYNIRYGNPDDGINWWGNRKAAVATMLRHYTSSIIGIQEGLHHQVEYLDSALVDYAYIGVGRDDGETKGEYTAIFYKKDVVQLLSTQTYWLSATPDTVSVGWDASMERIVTFGAFRDTRTGDTLYVFNAHFDHIGPIARSKSTELILRIIADKGLEDHRVIVMGDFNCQPDDKPIAIFQTIFNDAYDISRSTPYGPIGTFNSFDLTSSFPSRIDYILTKNIDVLQYINLDDRRANNLYLSDHTPVLIHIK